MDRAPGLSVRLKLTLSYAGFLMVAGILLIAVVWLFLLRYVPEQTVVVPPTADPGGAPGAPALYIPGRYGLWRAFAPKAVLALAFLLVFGLLGGWVLAGRMLAPLRRITGAARAARGGSLSGRIRLPGPRDELRELADEFDAMLDRLEAHVVDQRRFAANASHELRTPLAITQTILDVARAAPPADPAEMLERLWLVNARAIDLTEALLLLSRAEQAAVDREVVDLSLAVEEAIETLLPFAEQRGVTVETSADLAHTLGSPALLLQLTTNLVHNAIIHNLPAAGTVWVTTRTAPGAAVLVVENTGEPLSPGVVAGLAEPFRRGRERVQSDHGGVGLGLAIVQSIARAHDGTLVLSPRPAGGLRVVVRLPPGTSAT